MGNPRHQPFALSAAQEDEYRETGVVRLPGLIPARDAAAMEAALWARVERRCGARRGKPATWRTERPAQLSDKVHAFDAMASPGVRALLDLLLPDGWAEPHRWGVPLVCFPSGDRWDVPHANWHLDAPAEPGPPRIARIFAVLAPSHPQGGGTVYAAGSHRVLRRLAEKAGRALPSAEARRLLMATEPWFADLESLRPREDRVRRFMQPEEATGGERLEVREMLGEAGDVILMHPTMLHAPAPNARDTPRMMLTQFVTARP